MGISNESRKARQAHLKAVAERKRQRDAQLRKQYRRVASQHRSAQRKIARLEQKVSTLTSWVRVLWSCVVLLLRSDEEEEPTTLGGRLQVGLDMLRRRERETAELREDLNRLVLKVALRREEHLRIRRELDEQDVNRVMEKLHAHRQQSDCGGRPAD